MSARVATWWTRRARPERGPIRRLSPTGIFGWLMLSTALSVVASLAPAVSASRRSIREEISYE